MEVRLPRPEEGLGWRRLPAQTTTIPRLLPEATAAPGVLATAACLATKLVAEAPAATAAPPPQLPSALPFQVRPRQRRRRTQALAEKAEPLETPAQITAPPAMAAMPRPPRARQRRVPTPLQRSVTSLAAVAGLAYPAVLPARRRGPHTRAPVAEP